MNFKSWRGDLFTSTDGAAGRCIQACPFLKRKTALFAGGRLHDEALWVYRFFDMFEMIESFPFFNPEPLRNFPEIKKFFFQAFRDPLP